MPEIEYYVPPWVDLPDNVQEGDTAVFQGGIWVAAEGGGGGPAEGVGDYIYLSRGGSRDATTFGFTSEDIVSISGDSIIYDDSTEVVNGWGYPLIKLVAGGTYSFLANLQDSDSGGIATNALYPYFISPEGFSGITVPDQSIHHREGAAGGTSLVMTISYSSTLIILAGSYFELTCGPVDDNFSLSLFIQRIG